MDRKNITIREDQTEWIEKRELNLSQFVRNQLDEEMGPSDEELEAAYRRTEARDRRVYDEWAGTSREATRSLGDAPAVGDWASERD